MLSCCIFLIFPFNSIPKAINEQMIEELIKYHKVVFATAEELEQIKKEG